MVENYKATTFQLAFSKPDTIVDYPHRAVPGKTGPKKTKKMASHFLKR